MSKRISRAEYKKRAKLLKKSGLVEYDLRKQLSTNQKRKIRRLWNGEQSSTKWGDVLNKKADKFTKRHVSDKKLKILKSQGYPVSGNTVFIPNDGYDSIHIKGNKIIKTEKGKKIIDFIIPNHKILDELERLTNDKTLPKDTFVTVRIGDNGPFQRIVFDNYGALFHYVSNWNPKDVGADREQLISLMSIIEYDRGAID